MLFGTLFFSVASVFLATTSADQELDDEYPCRKLYAFDATTPGILSSPHFGKKVYPTGLFCKYMITAPDSYRIKITFKEFEVRPSTSCEQDRLEVYSLKNPKKKRIGGFCGELKPNPILSMEGDNQMYLTFQTGIFAHWKGFQIQYESSPNFKSVCEEGFIQCENRNCYKEDQKCDGVDNCGDGTDEENCGKPIETQPEQCGLQAIKPNVGEEAVDRMVGGDEVVPNSWPWQVSLQNKWIWPNNHFCGGTLINAQWVLTAAHCAAYARQIRIHLGAHNKFRRTEYEQIRRNARTIVYPELEGDDIVKNGSMEHDIALIKLNAPVTFTKGVQPACLPDANMKLEVGKHCIVTGWGETRGSGGSDVMKQQDQYVLNRYDCGFYDSQICVGNPKKATCHGDSGSSLNCKVGDKWFVYGALSILTPANYQTGLCGGPDAQTLYASSEQKAEWIKTIVNKYS